jgi:hypothetical protein
MKEIGLRGPRIRRAYANMGVLGFADADIEAVSVHDEQVGEEFDRRGREIGRVAAAGGTDLG